MLIKSVLLGIGALVVVAAAVAPFLLAPGPLAAPHVAEPVPKSEHDAILEALRPPKRERPVIAIITRNDGTEVADLLTIYGVLSRAEVGEVVVVAERNDPIRLYPAKATVEEHATAADFDARYPDGADYVLVPAMDPGNDPFVAQWIVAQLEKGARIVSVCNGSRVLSAAGLLDGRRATGHWSAIAELQRKHPTMEWVPDRRYVTDNGVTTSTGITATIPTMITLVEAIAGRDRAEAVAQDLGVSTWDSRHHSADFGLTIERMKTFIRNTVSIWRRETIGVPVADGVDEVALGFVLDAFSRTQLTTALPVGPESGVTRTRHGLVLGTTRPEAAGDLRMIATPEPEAPVRELDRTLAEISERYGPHTADIVALVMEYPRAAGSEQ